MKPCCRYSSSFILPEMEVIVSIKLARWKEKSLLVILLRRRKRK